MTGKEAIIDKIISDAKKIVNSTNEEGNVKAQEIIEEAKNDAKIYREKNLRESYAEREEILQRRRTAAKLEVKKLILGAKQRILDEVFEKALEEIRSDKSYKALLLGMLFEASDGDLVTVSERDRELLTERDIAEFSKSQGISLKLNPEYGKFAGGMIFSGDGADKNLTLEVELDGLRDESEPDIAGLLFDGK